METTLIALDHEARDKGVGRYFMAGHGIDQDVISTDIGHYLGKYAAVRPGHLEAMAESLKEDTRRWRTKKHHMAKWIQELPSLRGLSPYNTQPTKTGQGMSSSAIEQTYFGRNQTETHEMNIKTDDVSEDAGGNQNEEPTALSSLVEQPCNIITIQQHIGQHQEPSSNFSFKSIMASFSRLTAATAKSTSDQVVQTNSATDTASAVAAWTLGALDLAVNVVTASAARVTADASKKAAHAAEVSVNSSKRSAKAAEDKPRDCPEGLGGQEREQFKSASFSGNALTQTGGSNIIWPEVPTYLEKWKLG
ncbi:putative transcription factor [Fusarium austroafricanum]|uniref:Putative transcription factor n=1 Tax=Fusarium austroafricanum TaxID=2364996 RepID=A0A8H4NZM6_9HYPO|nr:putative transcription factor [Fusarium austroafricanum]